MATKQEVEKKAQSTFIKVSEVDEGGKIKAIHYAFEVYNGEKKDGYFHYFIPGFNIFFFAKTKEEGEVKAKAAMTSFFNYWVKNQGKKAFLEEIKRLGFEERKIKLNRNYKLPTNRPNIPSAFSERAFSSAKIAA